MITLARGVHSSRSAGAAINLQASPRAREGLHMAWSPTVTDCCNHTLLGALLPVEGMRRPAARPAAPAPRRRWATQGYSLRAVVMTTQTWPRHPLRWCGIKSTVPDIHHLDEQPCRVEAK